MAYLTDDSIVFNSGRSVLIPGSGGFIGINKDLWLAAGCDMCLISPNSDAALNESSIHNEAELSEEEVIELAECMVRYWSTFIHAVKTHGLNKLSSFLNLPE